MGLYHMKRGEFAPAESCFTRAAAAEGTKGSAFLYLGMVLKQKGQLGRAATYLKASASANPKDVTPHLHLLEVYHAAGLGEMTLQEGEILSEMIGENEDLFRETVDLIMTKGSAGDVLLSGDIVLPVLYQAMAKRSDTVKTQMRYLKKVLDKE
jgi:tetratricopeptide (TPR) repeat protein